MRLDEALLYRWAGKDIRRKAWGADAILKHTAGSNDYLDACDIDADDWEVVPKYVGWDKAWEALLQGKHTICHATSYNKSTYYLKDGNIRCKESGSENSFVPTWWLSHESFEIVEE